MTTKITDLDDDATYYVSLKRPIRVNRTILRPGARVTMKGKAIKENADGIDRVQAAAH